MAPRVPTQRPARPGMAIKTSGRAPQIHPGIPTSGDEDEMGLTQQTFTRSAKPFVSKEDKKGRWSSSHLQF